MVATFGDYVGDKKNNNLRGRAKYENAEDPQSSRILIDDHSIEMTEVSSFRFYTV